MRFRLALGGFVIVTWAVLALIAWGPPSFPPAPERWVARYHALDQGDRVMDFEDLFVQAVCLGEAPAEPCEPRVLGLCLGVFALHLLALGGLLGLLSSRWRVRSWRGALVFAIGLATFLAGERAVLWAHAEWRLGTDGEIILGAAAFLLPWLIGLFLSLWSRRAGGAVVVTAIGLSGGFFVVPMTVVGASRVVASMHGSVLASLLLAFLAPTASLALLGLVWVGASAPEVEA
jgi:hypothetical protein